MICLLPSLLGVFAAAGSPPPVVPDDLITFDHALDGAPVSGAVLTFDFVLDNAPIPSPV